MRRLLLLALAACYSPQPQPGSPCDASHPCPDPLVCSTVTSTCVRPGTTPPDARGSGDASSDAPAAPANDLPSGATPITDPTTITEDVTYAHDDASAPATGNNCGTGGRDVYFTISLTDDEVWYLDTFGSTYDTVIRVYHGACVTGVAPNGTTCRNNSCGGMQSQFSGTVTAGDNCVVIDEDGGGTGPAMLVLHVERGYRDGSRLSTGTSQLSIGSSCGSSNVETGSCGGAGLDDGYFFTACPGVTRTLTATTCNAATTFDTVLYARGPGMTELACDDNDGACTATTAGASTLATTMSDAHLFWLIVDAAADGACGAYNLTTTLQ